MSDLKETKVDKNDYFSDRKFESLKINPNVKKALKEVLKFEYLTKIQDKTIDHLFLGKDLVGAA